MVDSHECSSLNGRGSEIPSLLNHVSLLILYHTSMYLQRRGLDVRERQVIADLVGRLLRVNHMIFFFPVPRAHARAPGMLGVETSLVDVANHGCDK